MVEKEKYLNQTDILRRQAEEKTTSMIENLEVMSEEMLHELRELRIQQIELKRQNQIELDIMRAYFKEREEQLLNIFVKAPLGIFHSVWEGRFLTANPALAKMLGYSSPEELISATHDMTTQIYADPIIRPQIMDALMKSDGWVHYDKILWRRKDGSVIAVDMTGRKVLVPQEHSHTSKALSQTSQSACRWNGRFRISTRPCMSEWRRRRNAAWIRNGCWPTMSVVRPWVR